MDDLFLTGNEKQIIEIKKNLTREFEMNDLVLVHYFFKLKVWQSPEGIFLNKGKVCNGNLKEIWYVGL